MKRPLSSLAALSVVTLLAFAGEPLRAEPDADATFERARKDFDAGQYALACPAFDSIATEAQPGHVYAAAYCYEEWGRSAEALQRFRHYLDLVAALQPSERAPHGKRVDHAQAAMATLGPLVSRVETAPEPAPSEPEKVDAIPIAATPSEPFAIDAEPRRPIDTLAWFAGAAGLAGVITGSVASVVVFQKLKIRDEECASADGTGRRPCSARGIDAVRGAGDAATIASIGFGVGVVGLVSGALLFWHAATATEPAAQTSWQPVLDVGQTGGWLGVQQQW